MTDRGRGSKSSANSSGRRTKAERRSLSESFADSTTKFFSGMVAKKNGFLSDISTKIENTFSTRADHVGSSTGSEASSSPPSNSPVSNTPPSRPQLPKLLPSIGSSVEKFSMPNRKKSITKKEAMPDMRTSTGKEIPNHARKALEKRFSLNGMNVSFDQPIYNQPEPNLSQPVTALSVSDADLSISDSLIIGAQIPNNRHTSSSDLQKKASLKSENSKQLNNKHIASAQDDDHNYKWTETLQHYEDLYTRGLIQPENKSNKYTENVGNDTTLAETQILSGKNSRNFNDVKRSDTDVAETIYDSNREHRQPAPKLATSKKRSNTVDEILFDDYIKPEVDMMSPGSNLPENLISFEPDYQVNLNSSGCSSKLQGQETDQSTPGTSVDYSDVEFGGATVRRSGSVGSEKSWSSNYSIDSQPDDITVECMEFMKMFVDRVFNGSEDISQTEKAKFGDLCQHFQGRLWFSRYVNSQRVHNKKVVEAIFFRLMQYFAVCLFECHEAEDFSPAKTLMNMCFTFYCEATSPQGQIEKIFLYTYLKDQPIWQSLRFWNAAYFDAVQCERSRRPMPTNADGNEEVSDDKQFQENITFGQLGTFACNMREFGLSKELCLEFLRKQCTIANLSKDQVKLLKDNMKRFHES